MSPANGKQYLVSAIVSTYNAERFLRGKLEDLEAQTIADRLEIIVIDSCSPQDERSIVAEFQGRYDNIRYLRTDRRETVYQAWNRGIRMASGEFVTNANTDDRLRPDAYETLVRALREHPECVLAYPDMRITQQENQTFQNHTPFGFRDWPPYSRQSLLELCCVGPFPLWRRSLHDSIGYFDERFKSAADYEFWLRASERHDFIHVPEFLGLYWLSDQTVSRNGDLPTLEYLQIQKEYRAKFARLAPAPGELLPAEEERFRGLVQRVRALEDAYAVAGSLTRLLRQSGVGYGGQAAPLPGGEGISVCGAAGNLTGAGGGAAGAIDGPEAVFAELQRFCDRHPDFPEGHHELAQMHYKRGEIGYAKKHFEKAVLLDPRSRQYSDSLQGFFRLELYQSLQQHTAELAAHPDRLECRLSAGMICILLDRLEAARIHYRKALELAPDSPLAQGNLAYLEARLAPPTPVPPTASSRPQGESREEGEGAYRANDYSPLQDDCGTPPDFTGTDPYPPSQTSTNIPSPLAGEGQGEGEAAHCDHAAGEREEGTGAERANDDSPLQDDCSITPNSTGMNTSTSSPLALNTPSPLAGEGRGGGEAATCDAVGSLTHPPTPSRQGRGGEDAGAGSGESGADARRGEEDAGYYSFSRPEIRRMVSRRARRILDVGCAAGKVGAGLKARQQAEVWGIECDPAASAAAARTLDRVIAAPVELALEQLPAGYFDSIVLADVLEHLVDPAAVLKGLSEKLTPTGELIVSLPNVAHWSVLQGLLKGSWEYQEAGILDRTHLKFFTRKSALALFAEAGFSATEVTPIALSGEPGVPETLLQSLQQAGVAGPEFGRESSAYQYLFRLVRPESLLTSIVMLTYNELDCTRECLDSIARNTPQPHEIILVDNGSTDGTLPYLREICAADPRYRLLENGENLGFAAGCNLGMRLARGGNILLLNNDVVVTPGWLGGMLECLEREPEAGIVGPMSNEVAGPQRVAAAGYRSIDELEEFARSFARSNGGRRIAVPRVVGFCMLFTRDVMEQVGELDVSFGSGNFEDDDFCLRAALKGFGCVIAGDVFIHHYGSRSFTANGIDYARAMATNRKVYDAKWDLGQLDESLATKVITRNAITEGRRLARKGELGPAIDLLLHHGIRFSPGSPEPYRALAQILLDAGKYQDALEVLEQVPGEPAPSTALLAARSHLGLGQPDRARELAERVLRWDPVSAGALHLAGVLALEQGDRQAADEQFRAALATDPGYGPAYAELAKLAWDRGDQDQALEVAELGFTVAPDDMAVLARYHEYASGCAALPREEQRVREAMALYPEHQGLAFGLVEVLLRQGRYPEAMARIEQAAVDFGLSDPMIDAALAVRDRVGVKAPLGERRLISLCMIVKDEARHLPTLLHSVGPLVDEIVVVDTGSGDRTSDIARLFGARIFNFPWNGSFSDARNFSLEQASCDWILVLDADEVLAPSDLEPLRSLVERAAAPIAYSFTTRNYTSEITRKNWSANAGEYPREERGSGWTPSEKVRLFPNDRRLRFRGAVHELLEPTLLDCRIPIHACDVPVHHYGKLDMAKNLIKQEQYYQLGLRKLEETGGDLASLTELARQATELERFSEATGLWHKVLQISPESVEAHFNLGYLHLARADFATAREHAGRAAELAPDMKEAAFNLAKCELFIGESRRALERSQDMLHTWPDYPPALSLCCAASLVLGLSEYGEATLAKLTRMGFDRGDYLTEYADGLSKGGRPDLAALLASRAGRGQEKGRPLDTPIGEVHAHARC